MFHPSSLVGKSVQNLHLESLLGFGSFASLYIGESKRTHKRYAVKCLYKYGLSNHHLDLLRQEIQLNQHLAKRLGGQHPHIVGFERWFETDAHLYMVFELVTGGDLHDHLAAVGGLGDAEVKRVFLQLLDAVEYCHQKHVYHRDLKPENILLTDDLDIKVCDFGLATMDQESTDFEVGTIPYMHPHVLNAARDVVSYNSTEADIWSLGVILFTIICGQTPWEEAGNDPNYQLWLDSPEYFCSKFGISKNTLDILKLCWDTKSPGSINAIRKATLATDTFSQPPLKHKSTLLFDNNDVESEEDLSVFDHQETDLEEDLSLFDGLDNYKSRHQPLNKLTNSGSPDSLKSWADMDNEAMDYYEPVVFEESNSPQLHRKEKSAYGGCFGRLSQGVLSRGAMLIPSKRNFLPIH